MEGNVKQMSDDLTHADLYNQIKLVSKDIENINGGILRLEKAHTEERERFVTKDQFAPVRNIAYGLVTIVVMTVLGAVLNGVVTKTNADSSPASISNVVNR